MGDSGTSDCYKGGGTNWVTVGTILGSVAAAGLAFTVLYILWERRQRLLIERRDRMLDLLSHSGRTDTAASIQNHYQTPTLSTRLREPTSVVRDSELEDVRPRTHSAQFPSATQNGKELSYSEQLPSTSRTIIEERRKGLVGSRPQSMVLPRATVMSKKGLEEWRKSYHLSVGKNVQGRGTRITSEGEETLFGETDSEGESELEGKERATTKRERK